MRKRIKIPTPRYYIKCFGTLKEISKLEALSINSELIIIK